MIVETKNRCSLGPSVSVTAIQAAKAIAAWPDGSPPRSGVPRPLIALVAITMMITRISAMIVSLIGASRRRSKKFVVDSLTCPEKTR